MGIGDKTANSFGKVVENDTAPIIVNSRTMLPIRFVAEALGASVTWNEETQAVSIKNDTTEILLHIGNNIASVNGVDKVLDVAPFIQNNRTYLPVRFVSENLGANVEWIPETQSVIITR